MSCFCQIDKWWKDQPPVFKGSLDGQLAYFLVEMIEFESQKGPVFKETHFVTLTKAIIYYIIALSLNFLPVIYLFIFNK